MSETNNGNGKLSKILRQPKAIKNPRKGGRLETLRRDILRVSGLHQRHWTEADEEDGI